MTVAEKRCDRIAIIINGQKVTEGTVGEVIKENKAETLEDAFFNIYKKNFREGL
jgi:sodium transport system ATP-binding protein